MRVVDERGPDADECEGTPKRSRLRAVAVDQVRARESGELPKPAKGAEIGETHAAVDFQVHRKPSFGFHMPHQRRQPVASPPVGIAEMNSDSLVNEIVAERLDITEDAVDSRFGYNQHIHAAPVSSRYTPSSWPTWRSTVHGSAQYPS